MFIMVIIYNYEQYENEPNSVFKEFNKAVRVFRKAWCIYCNESEAFKMHYKHLVDFMYDLREDLGVPENFNRS